MAMLLESPEISGLLYKRRGGFGKMMPNAWQFRFFAVSKDGVLSYFDTDMPGQLEGENGDAKARGKLDLRAVSYELGTDSIEGAPTPHAVTLFIPNEEKWRLCAETKDDQQRWLRVFQKYQAAELKTFSRAVVSYASDEDDRVSAPSAPTPKASSSSSSSRPAQSLGPSSRSGSPLRPSPVAPAPTRSPAPHPPSSPTPAGDTSSSSSSSAASRGKRRLRLGEAEQRGVSERERAQRDLLLVSSTLSLAGLGLFLTTSYLAALIYLALANVVVLSALRLAHRRSVIITSAGERDRRQEGGGETGGGGGEREEERERETEGEKEAEAERETERAGSGKPVAGTVCAALLTAPLASLLSNMTVSVCVCGACLCFLTLL